MKRRVLMLVSLLLFGLVLTSPILSSHQPFRSQSVLFASAQQVNGTGNQTQTNQTVYYERELAFDRNFYVPVKVMISYPYTHNTNVTDITTIGFSSYKYDVTPNSITFIASEIDIYTFTVQITYDNFSLTNILITIWQGDLPGEGYTWTDSASTFVVHFRLNMTIQPSYPTEAQVAAQVVAQMQATFQQELEQQRETLAATQENEATVSIIVAVDSVVCIIALLLAGFGQRRRRMIPEEASR
jgi:hypothetical protein